MKQLFITLALVLAFGTAMAQTNKDSLSVTSADSALVASDSVSATIVNEAIPAAVTAWSASFLKDSDFGLDVVLPIVTTAIVFSAIVGIIFIIFYFKSRTKRAEYELVSQALAAGKELPKGLFTQQKEIISNNNLSKGVKNTFLGLGLGLFLWALTDELGLGCIGFMIMFMGIGQVIIYKVQHTEEAKRNFGNEPKPSKTAKETNEVEIIYPENEENNKAE